jgi:dihydroneopterin aldolase
VKGSFSSVELNNLELPANIGTYGPRDVVPEAHFLDLTLLIATDRVLVATDEMANVFDYDPLLAEIDRIAGECHYETQERLMTKIAAACVRYNEVQGLEMRLSKQPVLRDSGNLGVRLVMDASAVANLRDHPL